MGRPTTLRALQGARCVRPALYPSLRRSGGICPDVEAAATAGSRYSPRSDDTGLIDAARCAGTAAAASATIPSVIATPAYAIGAVALTP